jgi:hypothetical protein
MSHVGQKLTSREGPVLADCVEKLENRAAPKISQMQHIIQGVLADRAPLATTGEEKFVIARNLVQLAQQHDRLARKRDDVVVF